MHTMDNPSNSPDAAPVNHSGRRRKTRTPPVFQIALITAIVFATFFVSFPPKALFSGLSDPFAFLSTAEPDVNVPTGSNTAIKIGIVSGHYENDSGTVCANGTTEADVNLKIATIVQQKLNAMGFDTDLLKENDPRLVGYHAAALVSIHNDSCEFINDQATGFKVAAAMSTSDINLANRLEACLRERYQTITRLPLHDSVTNDMTFYHAFNEIDPGTPAAIIETGFLNLDYDILTNNTGVIATGVADGVICFVNNENIAPTATP